MVTGNPAEEPEAELAAVELDALPVDPQAASESTVTIAAATRVRRRAVPRAVGRSVG